MTAINRLRSMMHKSNSLKQAVGILFVTVLISNILGLVRNVIIANRVAVTYGTIGPLDSYYAAFVLPDLLYSILIVGALSSAVLPLLVKTDEERGDEAFWKTFNTIFSTGVSVISVALVALYFLLPIIVPRFLDGFSDEQLSLTLELSRVLILSPLFFTVSQLMTSALQAKKLFFAPALSPIIYNLAIICAATLIPQYGLSILVFGVVLGAFAHFLVQFPSMIKIGWRFKFTPGFGSGEVRHVFKLMIPRAIALTSGQLLLIGFYQMASMMRDGSIAIYKLTDDLQTAPVLLFANTLAMAILPDFARKFARSEFTEFADLVSKTLRLLIYLFVPIIAYLIIFRDSIIGLYISLGHAIDPSETSSASLTFLYFVVSLFFQGGVLILARSYFARGDTAKPTVFSIVSFVFAYFLARHLSFVQNWGPEGLALSYSVGLTINFILLFAFLKLPLSRLLIDSHGRQNFLLVLLGLLFSTAAMISFSSLTPIINEALDLGKSYQNLIELLFGFLTGTAVYLAWSAVVKLEQWQMIRTRRSSTQT